MKTMIGNLKKAVVEMLILKLLSEDDMYGYQITQEIKKRSSGLFTLLEGSMYPILYRLTDSHCISFYEKQAGKRQRRIYYHLEPLGFDRLQNMLTEYRRSVDIIDFLLNSSKEDCYEPQ